MERTTQEKLKTYLDGMASNGEITSYVMRRIRIEAAFPQRDKTAYIWAINFALLTAIANLAAFLQNLPYGTIFSFLSSFRRYWAPNLNLTALTPLSWWLALLPLGLGVIIFLNAKKLGGNRS